MKARSIEEMLRDPRPISGGDGTDDKPEPKPEDKPEDKPDGDKPKVDEPFDEDRAKAKIAKANSEAANLRKRLKEAEAAETKLKELEDAKKSDLERAADKATSLEDRATKAETDLLRLRVALKKNLTESQAKRLIGTTEEELEADADELLESFGTATDKGKPSGKPKERLRGGGDPTEDVEEMDPRKLAAKVLGN